MSNVMFYGILKMPFEMAMNDKISQYQFYQTVQQAVARLEKIEEVLEQGVKQ